MNSLKVLILSVIVLVSSENCAPNINLTLYQDVNDLGQKSTIEHTADFEDLFHIIIANQTIPNLCPNAITIHNELTILQIINSSISHIHPGAFNITPTLSLIRISSNPLTTILKNIFNAIKVKEIDLSQNQINFIEAEAFDNNTHLEIVTLNNNQIKEINPNWFVNSPNVYKLSVIYNDIKMIPAGAFRNMAQHRPLKLRLSANRITEIAADAFNNHTTIQLVRINGNKLDALPDGIFINRTIENLQINTNKLLCFPDAMFKAELKVLAFVDNTSFKCSCLKKVKEYVEERHVDVLYPSVICEDKVREVNVIFNYNKTYEIPLLPPTVDADAYARSEDQAT